MMSGGTAALVLIEQRGELAIEEVDGVLGASEVAFDVGGKRVEDNEVATITEVQNPSYELDRIIAELSAECFDPEITVDQICLLIAQFQAIEDETLAIEVVLAVFVLDDDDTQRAPIEGI